MIICSRRQEDEEGSSEKIFDEAPAEKVNAGRCQATMEQQRTSSNHIDGTSFSLELFAKGVGGCSCLVEESEKLNMIHRRV